MTRTTLAFAAILIASFTSGCGYGRYRPRVVYAVPAPVEVVAVRPVPAPPRPIVVHAPAGSVVIVNPNGRPQVVHPAPVAPDAPETPVAPAAPADDEEGWFDQR